MAEKITVFDTALRDGEQSPGASMNLAEKMEVARSLRNLNVDVEWLRGVLPSTENLVIAIWNRLAPSLPEGVALARLVLWETARNRVEYEGG